MRNDKEGAPVSEGRKSRDGKDAVTLTDAIEFLRYREKPLKSDGFRGFSHVWSLQAV